MYQAGTSFFKRTGTSVQATGKFLFKIYKNFQEILKINFPARYRSDIGLVLKLRDVESGNPIVLYKIVRPRKFGFTFLFFCFFTPIFCFFYTIFLFFFTPIFSKNNFLNFIIWCKKSKIFGVKKIKFLVKKAKFLV